MVTRTVLNDDDPLVTPDGTPIADAVFTFALVDEAKRDPITLIDAVSGELIRGDVLTATTNASGVFERTLWPNSRGEVATLYKVTVTGAIKPFYIRVAEGETALTLVAARTAYEANSPQTLSLFDALLAQIIATIESMNNYAPLIARGTDEAVTAEGFTTAVETTRDYTAVAGGVVLRFGDITGVSNAGTLTLTDPLPEAIRPSIVQTFPVAVYADDTWGIGLLEIDRFGIVSIFKNPARDPFAASGTKWLLATTITYYA